MTLRSDAERLLRALASIVAHSEAYADRHRSNYIAGLASSIKPNVDRFELAIRIEKSKENAQAALSELAQPVRELSAAASKGEMDIFLDSNQSLEEYWHLHTIFRELQYKNDSL